MVVTKRNNLRCELCIGDVKIKKLQKFSYIGSLVTDDLPNAPFLAYTRMSFPTFQDYLTQKVHSK